MKKAVIFIVCLLAALLVATWAARFSAELSGMTDEQWSMGGMRLAMLNWAITIVISPIAFFWTEKKSDLYAASAAGIVIAPAIGFLACMLLLK